MDLHSSWCHSQFTPKHISTIWNVGVGMAKDILTTTTQKEFDTLFYLLVGYIASITSTYMHTTLLDPEQ